MFEYGGQALYYMFFEVAYSESEVQALQEQPDYLTRLSNLYNTVKFWLKL